MNKRAWIKIIEAFFSILIIATALITVIQIEKNNKIEDSSVVYDNEISILSYIQLNQTLRDKILEIESLPVKIEDMSFPNEVKNVINEKIPSFAECEAGICWINESCDLYRDETSRNVYAKSAIISSNITDYSPRQLKLFCWIID